MADTVGDHKSFKLFWFLISKEYIGIERRKQDIAALNLGRRKKDEWETRKMRKDHRFTVV